MWKRDHLHGERFEFYCILCTSSCEKVLQHRGTTEWQKGSILERELHGQLKIWTLTSFKCLTFDRMQFKLYNAYIFGIRTKRTRNNKTFVGFSYKVWATSISLDFWFEWRGKREFASFNCVAIYALAIVSAGTFSKLLNTFFGVCLFFCIELLIDFIFCLLLTIFPYCVTEFRMKKKKQSIVLLYI